MSTVFLWLGLAFIWVLAWGSASVANVLSGLLVSAGLIVLTPDHRIRRAGRLRPVGIARFVGYVLVKVVESNVQTVRDVLSPRPRIHTAVIGVPLPGASDGVVTVIANTMALTPGTIPLEVTREPTVLYAHILHARDEAAARREVHQLARVVYRAFAADDDRDALEQAIRDEVPVPEEGT